MVRRGLGGGGGVSLDSLPARPGGACFSTSHVGMAQEEGKVGSYREFADRVLPWIQASGYNAVQLMAVMEHPYYASFGYQVSNFFAPPAGSAPPPT